MSNNIEIIINNFLKLLDNGGTLGMVVLIILSVGIVSAFFVFIFKLMPTINKTNKVLDNINKYLNKKNGDDK